MDEPLFRLNPEDVEPLDAEAVAAFLADLPTGAIRLDGWRDVSELTANELAVERQILWGNSN